MAYRVVPFLRGSAESIRHICYLVLICLNLVVVVGIFWLRQQSVRGLFRSHSPAMLYLS